MIKKVMVLLFSLFWFATSLCAENNLMFEKANQLYHNKLYDSAASLYSQMIRDGYCHADLYYNAGNAFYRIQKNGMAIWCYKKALQIEDKSNYRENLLIAQKKIKGYIKPSEEIFFMRWWKNTYNLMSVNKWAITALLFFLTSLVLFSLRNIFRKNVGTKAIAQVTLLLSCVSIFFLGIKYYHQTYHFHGILIQNNIPFVSGSKSTTLILNEGNEVEFIARKGKQLQVKLADGQVGIIPETAFKKL